MTTGIFERGSAEPKHALERARARLSLETDCWDVHQALKGGKPDFLLVDVRGAEAYQKGHVPTAHRVAIPELDDFAEGFGVEANYVVYCTGPHCNGADRAASALAAIGRRVKIMLGGAWGWEESGFDFAVGDEPGQFRPAEARMTVEDLRAFGRAWTSADIETLMSYIADDCVYKSSVGPEPGETFRGKEAVRRGFEKLLDYDSTARGTNGSAHVYGDRGTAEWSYFYEVDGRSVEVEGCDLFEFRGKKIISKNGFRKNFAR